MATEETTGDSRVNDGVARVGRTGVWLGAAETIIQFVEAFIKELNEAQHVAALGMTALVINGAVVLFEEIKGRGLFLRKVPSPDVAVAGE